MPVDSDYGVFEMGMNHAGEIAALTRMVRPHVALVTEMLNATGVRFSVSWLTNHAIG